VTEFSTEPPDNVVPIAGRDPTNAERQRRYRERHRNGSRKSGRYGSRNGKRNGDRNGRSGDKAQPIGTTSSSAVRYAAQAAGHAAELIEFPASRRLAEVTQEPVTQAPSPDIPPDNSRPKVAPRPVAYAAVIYITKASPDSMTWLSVAGRLVCGRGARHQETCRLIAIDRQSRHHGRHL
jgi:hypothetical protein